VPLKDVALCFALGEGTPIVAIEAASDCWLGLAAGFALFAVMGEVPIEALLRMSCLSLLVVAVTGALTAAWGLAAATAVALGASAGREGLAAPAPGPVPVPAPAGRAAAELGGRIEPLDPMRDRGIARLTSTFEELE
jgi:hypothetical protein